MKFTLLKISPMATDCILSLKNRSFSKPLADNKKMKTGLFAILNTAITKNFSNNDKRVTADSSKE